MSQSKDSPCNSYVTNVFQLLAFEHRNFFLCIVYLWLYNKLFNNTDLFFLIYESRQEISFKI